MDRVDAQVLSIFDDFLIGWLIIILNLLFEELEWVTVFVEVLCHFNLKKSFHMK